MYKTYQRIFNVFILAVLAIVFMVCDIAEAKPNVKLKVFPNLQTIHLTHKPPEIVITARTPVKDAKFTWGYKGPGRFQEDKVAPILFYFPPDKIDAESAQAVINVTVTDSTGDTASDSVTLTLLAPVPEATATPIPKPTSTPKPTATPKPRPTATPKPQPTTTPTSKPTVTPRPKPTATPTLKPTVTPRPKPTATPTPQPTATPKPTETPVPQPTATPTPEPTMTPTSQPTAVPTPLPTATPIPELTAKPTSTPAKAFLIAPAATPVLPVIPELPSKSATIPMPTATPTAIPTVMPTTMPTTMPISREDLDPLLEQAERYLQDDQLTTPKGQNAFERCKEILSQEPQHQRARQILREIAERYRLWGNRAYESWENDADNETEWKRAERYYARYQLVVKYIAEELGDSSFEQELQEVQARLREPGTPSPTPTSAPITLSTEELLEELALIQKNLSENDQRYKNLKERELQGVDVTAQLLSVLKDVVKDLEAIERIYSQLPQNDDIVGKYTLVKEKHRVFEQERFEKLKQELFKHYQQYEELKRQENEGIDLRDRAVPVLRNIVESLEEIRQIDERLFQDSPEMIDEIKQLREAYEVFKEEL